MYMYIVKRYDWVILALAVTRLLSKNQNIMTLMVLHDLMLLEDVVLNSFRCIYIIKIDWFFFVHVLMILCKK